MFGDEYRQLGHDARDRMGWHHPIWYSHDGSKAIIAVFRSPFPPYDFTLNEKAVRDHVAAVESGKLKSAVVAIVRPNNEKPETITRLPLSEVFDGLRLVQPRSGSRGSYWRVDDRGRPVGNYSFNGVPF